MLAKWWLQVPFLLLSLFAFLYVQVHVNLRRRTCSLYRFHRTEDLSFQIYHRFFSFQGLKAFHMLMRFLWTKWLHRYFFSTSAFSVGVILLCEFSIFFVNFILRSIFRYLQGFVEFGIIDFLWFGWVTGSVYNLRRRQNGRLQMETLRKRRKSSYLINNYKFWKMLDYYFENVRSHVLFSKGFFLEL